MPPFSSLKPYVERRFLPASIDLGCWEEIEPHFDRLETALDKVVSVDDLERWLESYGEFLSAVYEERTRRNIAMTCQTDDPEREKAFLHFVEEIEPRLKPRNFRVEQKLISRSAFEDLLDEKYAVFKRAIRNDVDLFREENVPLHVEETKLQQKYQKVSGAMTVEFEGREQTLVQLGKYLEEPDREKRRVVFELIARRRAQDRDELDQIFEDLLKLRVKIASNAGFQNYRDYIFKAYERFDYSPADCVKFHDAVEKVIVPLVRQIQEDRRKDLGLGAGALKPWDLAVDARNRPPLKPFSDAEELIRLTEQIFQDLDGNLAASFSLMKDRGMLDLENRKGKAPGGYQSTLQEARMPFIFMNAVGLDRDVQTLLHESGHAFHALAARDIPLWAYRGAPIEFCEVASMSMELLAADELKKFYSEKDLCRARLNHLRDIVTIFPWIAQVDAYQHWIYLHPDHTRDERTRAWLELSDRFGGIVDWSGFEYARESLWHRQLHIFEVPFYYIEYGIAQLGALQVWNNSRRDFRGTLDRYRAALALGGSRPLPELFAAAGARFDFSVGTIAPLIADVAREYETLQQKDRES